MKGNTCADCASSGMNQDAVLWCYHPNHARPAPDTACADFEREPSADAIERDASRVWYEHGEDVCTICGRPGHVAASCNRGRA